MLLPHDYVVLFQFLQCGIGQFVRARQCVGHDAQAQRAESLRLGNHGPENLGEHVLAQELALVAHGHQLNGVGVYGSLVGRTRLYLMCVNGEVAGQLGSRHHGIVGNDDIAGAVVQNANHRTVVHRPASQVAHALARSFAIEIAALQCGQRHTYLLHIADGRHLSDFIVHKVGHVHGDVAAVALGPTVLPQVACYFGYLFNLRFQGGASFQNTFHSAEMFFSYFFYAAKVLSIFE